MRKLIEGEIYNKIYSNDNGMKNAMAQQLFNNISIIAPEHLQVPLMDLKVRSRNSYYAFLPDALTLFETRGLIRLFNIGTNVIPTVIPYFPGTARNRVKDSTAGTGTDRVIFVNMYRIGHWSSDEKEYLGVAPLTDLYSCLESGVIGYKINIENNSEKLFSNKQVLEYLSKIYTFMFSLTMQKTKTTYGGSDFQNDCASFLISKFFLLYVLKKPNNDSINDYAYLAVQNKSSLTSLLSYEDISQIDYSSLSAFLNTFGQAFYNGEGVSLVDFETRWVMMFGDSTGLAIEFAPFLLHYLFAVLHGATLMGSLRLMRYQDNLKKLGLAKLYNAVVSVLK